MNPLTFARAQMGLSLAFHMIFAALGVALPLFMVIYDVLYYRTRDTDYLELSKRMAKGTSILFAVGAVSGTVLSFELGLLWPTFMGTFGEVVGLPFALEGFAFFTEAIFLGIYLYGRGKIPARLHLAAGAGVAVSGAASAMFVTLVNSLMNSPTGFVMSAGHPTDIDPWAAMWSPAWRHEVPHALLACYQATAFAIAGVHAAVLLKHRTSTLFRKALAISLAVGCIMAVLQPLSGDIAAKAIAEDQPVKLAASEAHFVTKSHAPLIVGGLADADSQTVRFGIEIPSGLSLLLYQDPSHPVTGLDAFPRDDWPNVAAVHVFFDIMVGAGAGMGLLALVTALLAFRKKGLPDATPYLWAVILASPLGMLAMEAGWMVTELGRQPWIVRGAMRTKDAVTPFQHLEAPFATFTLTYVFLGVTVVYLLWRQLRAAPLDTDPHSSVLATAAERAVGARRGDAL